MQRRIELAHGRHFSTRRVGADADLWRARALVCVSVITAFRVVGATLTSLTDTEAYYASWSSFPDWSYYDHPPMVAWTAWLVGHVSHSAAALRATPIACSAATSMLLFELTSRFFTARAAFLATLLHLAIPAYFFLALLVNPEATLAPCWMLALLALDDLRRHREPHRPLLLGAAIGVAFLSKYTAVLLVPVTLSVVVCDRHARPWLRRPSFYAGGLVALVIASPVVAWNAARGWPSLQLHVSERVTPMSFQQWVTHASDIALAQFLLYQPVIVPFLIVAAVMTAMRARRDARYRFLALTSLPVIAFFEILIARVPDAEPHWFMVGALPLLIALGSLADEAMSRVTALAAPSIFACSLASLFLVVGTIAHAGSDAFERDLPRAIYDGDDDAMHETVGWDLLRSALRDEAARLGPSTVVAAAHNVLCGHLLFELDDRPRVYCPSARRTALDFVGRRNVPVSAPVIFVESSRAHERAGDALPTRRCTLARRLSLHRADLEVARYDLIACVPRGSSR